VVVLLPLFLAASPEQQEGCQCANRFARDRVAARDAAQYEPDPKFCQGYEAGRDPHTQA